MNDKGKKTITIESLVELVKSYHPKADINLIERAYLVAAEGHQGQTRVSGEPYISHPLNVAYILAELHLDDETISAAILHDVVEDTLFTFEEVQDMFGTDISDLIDGVTKLGKIPFMSKEEQQLETYRKMFLAMAKDIRVIMIKLADRLHNMRTLKYMREDKRQRIAKETMEVYAPLANRLGINNIKWELEDLSLRYLEPEIYYDLVANVKQKRRERQNFISEAVRIIEEVLDDSDIHASISGRAKHFYSIYKKMMRDHKDIGEIYDLSAVRILVDTVKDCYNVLGVIHSKWFPMPGRFKDYIAMPKSNGYQSLHTTVMALGYPLEIQIRTYAMHKISEFGVAAHWKYKESGKSVEASSQFDEKMSWLHHMIDLQEEISDPKEYLEALKVDIFSDEVFVFTPSGDILSLPQGSNPIDFAYRVHTEVGNHCVGAKINGKIVTLDHKLQNGDFVEIITSKTSNGPSRDWLNIVASSDTRSKIRAWFKKENREENIQSGREILEREIKKYGYVPKDMLKDNHLKEVASRLNIANEEDLLAGIGYGGTNVQGVMTKLVEIHNKEIQSQTSPEVSAMLNEIKQPQKGNQKKTNHGVLVEGESGFFVRLAKCCNPIPGDPIAGYITRGRGVSVHRSDCPNIMSGTEMERMIEVSWDVSSDREYPVEIEIICNDKSGALTKLLAMPAEMKLNIHSVHATPNKSNKTSTIDLVIYVKNAEQVTKLMKQMQRIEDVFSVSRPIENILAKE